MISWVPLPGEELFLYSPIGLRLIDDLTGGQPIGPVEAELDLLDGTDWRPTRVAAVQTQSSILTYPGLGLAVDVAHPAQRYRVRLSGRYYIAAYRHALDGIEFDAPRHNHSNPPASPTTTPTPAVLLPAANYPFVPHIPVLRGVVHDAGGNPVADVLVEEGMRERVLTDERGAFSLPLRWVPEGAPTAIVADDTRNGRAGGINVTLPAALDQSQTITVT